MFKNCTNEELCEWLHNAMRLHCWKVAKEINQELTTRISEGQFPDHTAG